MEEIQPQTQVSRGEFKKWAGSKFQRLDMKSLRIARYLLDEGIAVGKRADVLSSIILWKEEKGFLTKSQRKLIQDINAQLRDFPYEQELCARLTAAFNNDLTPPESEGFIRAMVEAFNEFHSWTPLQKEQVLLMVEKAEGEQGELEKED